MFVVGDAYNLWNRSEVWETVGLFKPLWDLDPYIIDYAADVGAPLGSGSVLGNVNMYTYRTPDFMMSSVQDYNSNFVIYSEVMIILHKKMQSIFRGLHGWTATSLASDFRFVQEWNRFQSSGHRSKP